MVIILHANVSSVVHQPCSCSRLQSAVFYLRDPITARLGAEHCRAAPSGTAAAPELPLALPGQGESSLGRKTRSRTEQLVFCFTGLLRKAWEWQDAVGHWRTLTEGPLSEGLSQNPGAVASGSPWTTAILIAI